jgi:hypothetical protein
MTALPDSGSVLGVDIGYSPTKPTSAACRLSWTAHEVTWAIQRFRYDPAERMATLKAVIGGRQLMAAAFDGPLRRGFGVINTYRTAEMMLTRQLGLRIGKPGGSNSPVGIRLNTAANEAAQDVLSLTCLAPARHAVAIDQTAIAEAFPTSFLGLMLADPAPHVKGRAGKSDRFYKALVADGTLRKLMAHLLHGRSLPPLDAVTNHDDRAGLVCAITALAVARNDVTAVGDDNGWMILPPWSFIQPWARELLLSNAQNEGKALLFRSTDAEERHP